MAEKKASALTPALASAEIGVTDGEDFATASLGLGAMLNLITWHFDGSQLIQHASTLGPIGKLVAVTKIASVGTVNRIVTAIKNTDNKLQLDVWDFNNIHGAPQMSAITHKDKVVGDMVEAIAIKNLGAVGDFSQASHLVTVVGQSNYDLKVHAWTVDSSGLLQKTSEVDCAGILPQVSSNSSFPTRVAIDTLGDGAGGFFDGHGFITTHIAGSWNLEVATWSVDDGGQITFNSSVEAYEQVWNQTIAGNYSIVSLADDPATGADESTVKLIKWGVDDNGYITRLVTQSMSLAATRLSVTGNLVTAFQFYPVGMLVIDSWQVLN